MDHKSAFSRSQVITGLTWCSANPKGPAADDDDDELIFFVAQNPELPFPGEAVRSFDDAMVFRRRSPNAREWGWA